MKITITFKKRKLEFIAPTPDPSFGKDDMTELLLLALSIGYNMGIKNATK